VSKLKLSEIQKENKRLSDPFCSYPWSCPECGETSFKCSSSKLKSSGVKRVRICECGVAFDTFEVIKRIRHK